MRNKKLIAALSLSYLNMRKLGLVYFVPVVVLFLLIPFLAYGQIVFRGMGSAAFNDVFSDFQWFIPFMGCWWVLFGLSDYAEFSAREILRTYKKSMLADFLILHVWYLLHVAVLIAGFSILVDNYWMDFLLICIQTTIFAAFSFFLLFVTKTIMAPFFLALLYEILVMLSHVVALDIINMFSPQRIQKLSQLLWPYLPILAVSIILVVCGNKFYQKKC